MFIPVMEQWEQWLEYLCASPRPVGSPRLRTVQRWLLHVLRDMGHGGHSSGLHVHRGKRNRQSYCNIWLDIPPNELTTKDDTAIVIGAHIDSVPDGVGADDNASGVCVLLDLATQMIRSSAACHVILVWFDAEEVGCWGSEDFARHIQDHYHVSCMINMDMVGRIWPLKTCHWIGTHHLRLQRTFVWQGITIRPKRVRDDIGTSDYSSFLDHGIPIMSLSSGTATTNHTKHDHPREEGVIDVKSMQWLSSFLRDVVIPGICQ